MKNGWSLLALSFICGILGFFAFFALAGCINEAAVEIFAPMGGIIGFISPSIVYFGNRM